MKKIALTVFLCCIGIAGQAVDFKQYLLDLAREKLIASGTSIPARGVDYKKQLLEKLRNRLPEKARKGFGEALATVSQEEEIAIGRQVAGNLLGAVPLVKDDFLQKYVNLVGRWVADQSELTDLPWHFGVIESSDVNAFAAPGGYIFVTRGLYALLQNEAELAGVLAHEIGHVLRKHHLKILLKSRLLNLGSRMVSQKIKSNEKAQKLIGSGAEIVARALDQRSEFEADRIAVVLTARAGYDAFSLPAVLQQIGHYAQDHEGVELLFKTHPHPDVRIKKLDTSIGTSFDKIQGLTLENRFYRISPRKN